MLLLFSPTTQARRRQGPRGRYDTALLLTAIALASLGLIMVASSSIAVAAGNHMGEFYYLKHQVAYLGLGLILAAVAMRVELEFVERHLAVWMIGAVVLLLLVFAPGIGLRINGARRWLDLGPLSFQPVEAMKLVLIVYLASYLVRHREGVEKQFFGAVKPMLVAVLTCVLLLAQPDFGSAVLLMGVTVGMIWLGGARMRYLVYMGLPLVPAAILLATSKSYRVQRITSFLNPWKDPFDNGFQLVQALIAIGRGEWFGVGLGGSIQKLFYLPEAHTDFIVAVIGEELGLFGIVLVVGLFALLVWRGLVMGLRGVELGQRFAGYVSFGISMMIGMQALVSIGVNLGVLPTKGLTLPLISAGGSSMLMTCLMLGIQLRATYEINRASDTRRKAVRRNVAAEKKVPATTEANEEVSA
ncbi:MAG TPA: putative lipid II flippase FtsW [Oleiagrimonas sp.]|nr:putative lipid II flippase FtsW [Oleiagrimonas sp.]